MTGGLWNLGHRELSFFFFPEEKPTALYSVTGVLIRHQINAFWGFWRVQGFSYLKMAFFTQIFIVTKHMETQIQVQTSNEQIKDDSGTENLQNIFKTTKPTKLLCTRV